MQVIRRMGMALPVSATDLLQRELIERGDLGELAATQTLAQSESGLTLICMEDHRALGIVVGELEHPLESVFVRWLVVDPSARCGGVGTALIDALERTPGISRLSGMVDHTDPVALAFWRSRGWTTRWPRPGLRRQLMHRELGWAVTEAA